MNQAPNPLWDELGKTIFLRGNMFDGKRLAEHGVNAGILVEVPKNVGNEPFSAKVFSILGNQVDTVQIDSNGYFDFSLAGENDKAEWTAIEKLLKKADHPSHKEAFIQICRLADKFTDGEEEGWQAFIEAVEEDRFEANTWQERDRTHLGLKDTLFNESVFDLWDEDAVSAIDDGLIAPPRGPRPFNGPDSAWLPSMLEYAESNGLITHLRHENATPAPAPRG